MLVSRAFCASTVATGLLVTLTTGCGNHKTSSHRAADKAIQYTDGQAAEQSGLQLTLPQETIDLSAKSQTKISASWERVFAESKKESRIQLTCDEETTVTKGVISIVLLGLPKEVRIPIDMRQVSQEAPDKIDFGEELSVPSPVVAGAAEGHSMGVSAGVASDSEEQKSMPSYPGDGETVHGPGRVYDEMAYVPMDGAGAMLKYYCKSSSKIKVQLKDGYKYRVYVRTFALDGQATHHGLSGAITVSSSSVTLDLKKIFTSVDVVVNNR